MSNWIYAMDKKKIFKMRPVNPPEFLEDGIITDRVEGVEKAEWSVLGIGRWWEGGWWED